MCLVFKSLSSASGRNMNFYLPMKRGDIVVDTVSDGLRNIKELIFGMKIRYACHEDPLLVFLGDVKGRTEGHQELASLAEFPSFFACFTFIEDSHSKKKRQFFPVSANARLALKMRPIAPRRFLSANKGFLERYDPESRKLLDRIKNPYFMVEEATTTYYYKVIEMFPKSNKIVRLI